MGRKVRVVPVRWLPTGVAGMTLGRTVLIHRAHLDDESLLAHELVHVRQWEELGVMRFTWQYLTAYAAARLRGDTHHEAYRSIPLEVEARRLSGQ